MTEKEKFACLKLALSENVGPITFKDIMAYFKSAVSAIENFPSFSNKSKRRPLKLAPDSLVYQQLELAQKNDVEILVSSDHYYPENLKHIDDAPPVLFVKGNKSLFKKQCIAIVGSRNASLNGINLTRKISFDLANQDTVVVSGMAKGIDRAAHEGALHATPGSGGTIAVLGTGIDVIYPKENADIYEQIKERGVLVSEVPFASKPLTSSFPRRNRIISGLSVGTVVIEANQMSGSLITAKEALSQGREVFAVPGSPLDPRSAGPNQLIKDGAHLVGSGKDILDALEMNRSLHFFDSNITNFCFDTPIITHTEEQLDQVREQIISFLSAEAISIEALIQETGIKADLVNAILAELEIAGKIERFVGQRVALIFDNEWSKL